MTDPRDLTPKEVATLMGYSEVDPVYRALRDGTLTGYRLTPGGQWRIPRAALDQLRFGGDE